jgi:hypothetical protein
VRDNGALRAVKPSNFERSATVMGQAIGLTILAIVLLFLLTIAEGMIEVLLRAI